MRNVIVISIIIIAVSTSYAKLPLEPSGDPLGALAAPDLVACFVEDSNLVRLVFSEPLDTQTSEDESNYEIYETEKVFQTIAVVNADLQEDSVSVHLLLESPFEVARSYTIRINNIEDLFGNPIAAGSQIEIIVPDTIPPLVDSAEMVGDSYVRVTYSELVTSWSVSNPDNYVMHIQGDPTDSISIDGIEADIDNQSAIITIGDTLESSTWYTLHISGVQDKAGNLIDSDTEISFLSLDTSPPRLIIAELASDFALAVTFSEPLDDLTAENAANYEFFELDEPDSLFLIESAVLYGGGTLVTLTMSDSVSTQINYGLRVSNLRDLSGNEIEPGSGIIIYETDPPKLISAVLYDPYHLDVQFSERLGRPAAEIPSYYAFYLAGDPSVEITILEAELLDSRDAVRLSLASSPELGVLYSLSVSRVSDYIGNEILPGTEIPFFLGDPYPPEILSCSALSATSVEVTFNEAVEHGSAVDPGNYVLYEASDPSATVPVASIELSGNDRIVTLSLAAPLVPERAYTLQVSGITDLSGNVIQPGSIVDVIYHSILSGYIGLYADANHASQCVSGEGFYPFTLWIWCRPSDRGQICAEFRIIYPANVITSTVTVNTPLISVTLGDLATGMSVCYVGCQTDWNWPFQQAMYCTDPTQTIIEIGPHPDAGVYQFANCDEGYPLESIYISSNLRLNCFDDNLVLLDAEPIDANQILVTFNRVLERVSAEEASNYNLTLSEDPAVVIPVSGAELMQDGREVILSLDIPMTVEGRYRLTVNNISDMDGNYIAANSIATFFYEPPDTESPTIVEAAITSPLGIEVVFSEPVDSATAAETANYELFELEDQSSVIPVIETSIAEDNAAVQLTLGDTLSMELNYVLRISNVQDLSGNAIQPGSEIIIYEEVPPELVTAEPIDLEHVRVAFNEPMHEGTAESVNNYLLFIADNPMNVVRISSASLDGNRTVVMLSLRDNLIEGNSYTLKLNNVTDIAGNAITPDTEINFFVADESPPLLVSATVVSDAQVEVVFSESLDSMTAVDAANYELFNVNAGMIQIAIADVMLLADSMTVRLSTTDQISLQDEYLLIVSNVEDLVGNVIMPGSELRILDTTPPEIVSAFLSAQYSIDIIFNEPLDEYRANIRFNYLLYLNSHGPSYNVPISHAVLLSDGKTVRLRAQHILYYGQPYTVRVSSMADINGNITSSYLEYLFTPYDIYPPYVESNQVMSSRVIELYFNESVIESSAMDISNYEIFLTSDPSVSISVTYAGLYNRRALIVCLSVSGVPRDEYTIRINNIQDYHGNEILPDSEVICVYGADHSMGLYVDLNHEENEVFFSASPTQFSMYVWCLPGTSGVLCEEFMVQYPANVIAGPVTSNDAVLSVALGDLGTGVSCCFIGCQADWFWSFSQTCFITDPSQTFVVIGPHPDVGEYQVANCQPGYPIEDVLLMSEIHINPSHATVTTYLQSYTVKLDGYNIEVKWSLSEIDEGVEFHVLRRSNESGDFNELYSQDITGSGLDFTFRDSDFEYGGTYHYRVEYSDGKDRQVLFESDPVEVPALPLTLDQNYPNPFNPATTIRYYLPLKCRVILDIFDINGKLVTRLVDAVQQKDSYAVQWEGRDSSGIAVASGVYFYRLTAGKERISRKMVLLR